MSDFLILKSGTYHVRLDVPVDPREAFGGRKVLTKSLRTGNRSEAHVARLRWLQQWKTEIERARKKEIPDFREEITLIVEKYKHEIEKGKTKPFNWLNPKSETPSASAQQAVEINEVIQSHKLRPKLRDEAIENVTGTSDYSPKTPFLERSLSE
jgi:hypothetical protein